MSEFASHSLISKAKAFHETVKICDGHNDLPWFINQLAAPIGVNGLDLTVNHHGRKYVGPLHACLHTDIPRLIHGGIGWQFWSVYVPSTSPGPMAVQMTLEQIDVVHRMIEKYPDVFELAYSSADVERIRNSGKIASMCGVEGGHQINSSLASLRMFYALGARYMTLTHNGAPPWADAAVDFDNIKFLTDAPKGGLTAFGHLVIQEMNRLGMLVDLSHVHQLTMKKAILASRAPVIFSHSSSRALCNHPRDVPDDILQLLQSNQGIIMITFVAKFIAGDFWVRGGAVGASVLEVADHIDHVKNLIGIDYIGIGGDYDGVPVLARGLEDVSCYPNLTAELLYRGYTEEDLTKLMWGNALRVMKRAEEVSKEMKLEGILPCEHRIEDVDG